MAVREGDQRQRPPHHPAGDAIEHGRAHSLDVAGHVWRRCRERGLAGVGGAALAVALATLAVAPDWRWACPACFIAGVGFYMLHSTLQTHATQMLPAVRGTAVSVFVVCLFGGQSLGVVLAAAVADLASVRWVFAACAVVIAVLCGWFATRLSAHARVQQA